MKKTLGILLVLSLCIAFSGCSASNVAPTDPTTTVKMDTGQVELTLDELAKYNGQNGQPAYVAVDGVIYDVTDLGKWEGGQHQGLHTAGTDLTEAIKNAPHGKEMLDRAKVVGKLK